VKIAKGSRLRDFNGESLRFNRKREDAKRA
jgi:hypothetical protein